MSVKKLLAAPRHAAFSDIALFIVRAVAGIAFMMHGWPKIQKPFDWMGPESFAPDILEALAAVAEFGGGLAWILGLLTPLASCGIASTMVVAFWMHAVMRGDPFVSAKGGPTYELAAIYFCVAVLLFAMGPGRLSIDRMLFGSR